MFNKTFVVPVPVGATRYVPYADSITVNEHKAPTDESIRLYEELKEKTRKAIIDTIEVSDNSFNVKAVIFKEPLEMARVCRFSFTLNGNEYSGEFRQRDSRAYDSSDFLKGILEKAADVMKEELLKTILRESESCREVFRA